MIDRQVREEIKGHARALNCFCIIGYRETTTIFEDVCILSAVGTAARCAWYRPSLSVFHTHNHGTSSSIDLSTPQSNLSLRRTERKNRRRRRDTGWRGGNNRMANNSSNETGVGNRASDSETNDDGDSVDEAAAVEEDASEPLFLSHTRSKQRQKGLNNQHTRDHRRMRYYGYNKDSRSAFKTHRKRTPPCGACHIPYLRESAPFKMHLVPCGLCGRRFVHEMLLSTVEFQSDLGVANHSSHHSHSQHHITTAGSVHSTNNSHDHHNTSHDTHYTTNDDNKDGPASSLALTSVRKETQYGLPVPVVGHGQLIEARVCRVIPKLQGVRGA